MLIRNFADPKTPMITTGRIGRRNSCSEKRKQHPEFSKTWQQMS